MTAATGSRFSPAAALRRLRALPPGDQAFLALFAAAACLALATFRDYGVSYDEAGQNIWYGDAIWRFFLSLGKDHAAVSTPGKFMAEYYGGLFDAFAEGLVRTRILPVVEARHLANVCAGLLGVWGCRATARLVGGAWAGFWAALLLLAAAPWYGHMFINAKDIPFAAGAIWTLYFLLRCARAFPDVPWSLRGGLGLTLGATMGVRVGGVVLACYALLAAGADLAFFALAGRGLRAAAARALRWASVLAPVFAVACVGMIALWPAALLHPVSIPLEGFLRFKNFRPMVIVNYLGVLLPSTKLPGTYIPVTLASILPEALVLLGLCCAAWAPWAAWRAVRKGEPRRATELGLLATAACFPLAWAWVGHVPVFDNLRHYLFSLPPAVALVAAGWTDVLRRVPRRAAAAAVAALALALGTQVARMAALHPYEYAFFSVLGGGMPEGARRFDSDYWITSYREAALRMAAHARGVAAARGVPFERCRFTVLVTASEIPVRYAVPPNFTVIGPDAWGILHEAPADYRITTTRWGLADQWPDWPVVAEVARLGMRFAVVKARPGLAEGR